MTNLKIASSNSPKKHFWRSDITGLRALAVIPVLIFHAFPELCPGGFFGVDIFFVISGYLISGIIFRGMLEGNFSYTDFYIKRIRRIIPNLVLVLLFVLSLGYWVLFSYEYSTLGAHSVSSALFAQNFKLLNEANNYFAIDADAKPLLHLWSLAIEEQFYIVFPIICVSLWGGAKQSVRSIGIFIIGLIGISFILCITAQNQSFAFYFPLSRFWELGVGITLAFIETFAIIDLRRVAKGIRTAMSLVGFVLILIAVFLYDPTIRTPGWFSLVPVFGSVLMIASYEDSLVNQTLLSCKPITFVGLISYSLYLWHWPFLSYLFYVSPQAKDWEKLCVLLIACIVAVFVYRFIENPLRRTQVFSAKTITMTLMTALMICAVMGLSVRFTQGIPSRNIDQAYPISKNFSDLVDPHQVLLKNKINDVDVLLTDKERFPEVLFIGDSHAHQYAQRAKTLANQYHVSAAFFTEPGCLITSGYSDMGDEKCEKARLNLHKLLSDARIKNVVIGQYWNKYMTLVPDRFNKSLDVIRQWTEYKNSERQYFVLLDYPCEKGHDYRKLGLKRFFPEKLPDSAYWLDYPTSGSWLIANQLLRQTLEDRVIYIEIEPYMCEDGKCNLLKAYRDDNHLRASFILKQGVWIDPVFKTKALLEKP